MASKEPAYLSIACRKQAQRAAAIPPEWRLKILPPASQTNVLETPRTCGILTAEELAITENHDATDLVDLLASGKLSSESVTRAFCKRAAVAQQVVSVISFCFMIMSRKQERQFPTAANTRSQLGIQRTYLMHLTYPDKLLDRDILRPSYYPRQRTRPVLQKSQKAHRALPWSSHQS